MTKLVLAAILTFLNASSVESQVLTRIPVRSQEIKNEVTVLDEGQRVNNLDVKVARISTSSDGFWVGPYTIALPGEGILPYSLVLVGETKADTVRGQVLKRKDGLAIIVSETPGPLKRFLTPYELEGMNFNFHLTKARYHDNADTPVALNLKEVNVGGSKIATILNSTFKTCTNKEVQVSKYAYNTYYLNECR